MFQQLEMAPADPIMGLSAAFKSNENPNKINLSVGVYQDASGQTPVLASVQTAQERVLAAEKTKSYLSIEGSSEYGAAVRELILGVGHEAAQRAITVQSPGGTGALRLAGDFLAQTPRRPARVDKRADLGQSPQDLCLGRPTGRDLSLFRRRCQ